MLTAGFETLRFPTIVTASLEPPYGNATTTEYRIRFARKFWGGNADSNADGFHRRLSKLQNTTESSLYLYTPVRLPQPDLPQINKYTSPSPRTVLQFYAIEVQQEDHPPLFCLPNRTQRRNARILCSSMKQGENCMNTSDRDYLQCPGPWG